MTREEAIDIIDDNFTVKDTHGHFSDEEVEEALDMAIKALKKQDRIAQVLGDYDLPDTWEILDDYDLLDTWEVLKMVKEVVKE